MNPGDKKAEEKFKEISEANDVLSDEKKRKIYDQLGFYSDNIDPGGGRGRCARRLRRRLRRIRRGGTRGRGGGQEVPFDFGGFDFSGFQGGAAHARRTSRHGRRLASATSSADVFRRWPARRNAWTPARHRPRVPGQVDFWTAIRGGHMKLEIQRQEVCPTCKGKSTRGGASAPSATAPARSRRWAAA